MFDYDVIVIGAGSAGLVACKLAHGLGKKTLLVEKRKIGGDCTWFGCIPSKTLIKSAHIAHQMTRLKEFGLELSDHVNLNCEKVMAHVRAVVEADAAGHPAESYEQEGISVAFGSPKFVDSSHIELDGRTISAKKFIICSGSRALIPSIEGLEQVSYLTNETIFDLEVLPESMIVLGAGPIGIELAAALNRLGVKVTVLLRSEQILKKEDPELTEMLVEILRAEGVNILTQTQTTAFRQDAGEIIADVEQPQGKAQIKAQSLLIAVGRVPNVDELALEKAGVAFDRQKGVTVDKHLRTTAKNIYAAGDVVWPYLFTHMAEYEAVIATTNASLPVPVRKTNYENVLWCTYTDPELARAGLTESQARERYGDTIRVYRWPHKNVDRARTDLTDKGLTKIVCDKKGMILGIHILGHSAAELMHEAQLCKSLKKPFSKISSFIHAYPSYSDAIRQPAKKCYIDSLQNSLPVKLIKTVTGKKNRIRVILLLAVIALIIILRMTGVGENLTLENLQQNGDKLKGFSNQHYIFSVLLYIGIYVVVAGFSLPGATIMTLAGGFLYNFFVGALYVNVGATAGATLAFLFARYIAGKSLQEKYGDRLEKFNSELDRNGWSYLLTLRFIPLVPFFMINIFAGLTKIPLRTFIWTTSAGIFPGSLIYAYAGQQLGTIKSVKDIFNGAVLLAFVLLIALAIFPTVYKKVKKFKAGK